jgi:hypothetical protein
MTMNFIPSRNRSDRIEPSDSKAEGFRAHAAECRELATMLARREQAALRRAGASLAGARRTAAAFRLAA